MNTELRISIMGCGWLGLPLALHLQKNDFKVKGSVTSDMKMPEIQLENIDTYKIYFNPELNHDFKPAFFETDVLYINIPPGRKNLNPEHFVQMNQQIIGQIKKFHITKVIFISSTSVYPDTNGIVTESMEIEADKGTGKVLKEVEQMYLNQPEFKTTILRFGGLIGGTRNPGRFLSGKKDVANAKSPVNLIHLDDCIGIITLILKNQQFGSVYNACMPDHPTKEEFYTVAAQKHNMVLPLFKQENECKFKIVDSEKLAKDFNYHFKFQSPMDCI